MLGTPIATLALLTGGGVIVTHTIMRDSLVMRDIQRMTNNG